MHTNVGGGRVARFDRGLVPIDVDRPNSFVKLDAVNAGRRVRMNVETALQEAEKLGGVRKIGPEGTPGRLVVGQFTDPERNLIGVAGTN